MNAEEPQPEKESILTHLVAGDESLKEGKPPQEPSDTDTPGEASPRLEGDLALIQMLRKVLSRRSTEAAPGAATGEGQHTSASDLPFQELGRFQIRRRLGQGAFGLVFLAFDPQLGREVALKVPRPEALLTGELRERFLREARAAAGMDHPNLVPLYEAGAVGPLCYIASAYCPGLTLGEWLKERTELPPERLAAELIARLADAVGHAHSRGVIHRDLKPSNVLLQVQHPDPDDANSTQKDPIIVQSLSDADLELVPRITDFGLAKLIGDATALQDDGEGVETRTGAVLGTPNYMAPEQASGLNKEIGPSADVYALGGILYELLAGRPPFRGESLLDTLEQVRTREPLPPGRLRPKLSRDLETICLKCLQKEPHKRYETAAALAEDLRRYLRGEPIHARPIRAWERSLKWSRRHPARAALWVVGILAPLVVAGITLAYNVKLSDAKDKLTNANDQLESSNNQLTGAKTQLENSINQLENANSQLKIKRDELAESNSQLDKKNRELKDAWDAEKTQRHLAEEGKRYARNLSYVSDMNLTQQDWATPRVKRMNESLQRQLPLPGEADLRGFEWYYWRRLLEQKSLAGHKGPVLCVACSPDGKLLASGGHDHTVRLWDAATGRQLGVPDRSLSPVTTVAFIAGRQTLAAIRQSGMVDLYDVKTRKLRHILRPRKPGRTVPGILAAAAATRQPLLALALTNGNVEIWDVGEKVKLRSVWEIGERGGVTAVALSADGSLLAFGTHDGTLHLWDAATGEQLNSYRGQKKSIIMGIAFAPKGERLATAGKDSTVRLWDRYAAKEPAVLPGHAGIVNSVQFAADGKTLVSASADMTVRVWDAVTGAPRFVLKGHTAAVRGAVFTPAGNTIVSASEDGLVKLWDATNPDYVLRYGHDQLVTQLAFTQDGRVIVTGGADGLVKLWDAVTARPQATLPPFNQPIQGIAIEPEGKHLAVVCSDRFVHICDRQTAKEVARLEGHKGDVSTIAFSPDGKMLASGDLRGGVRIWDWQTRETMAECTKPVVDIRRLVFSPDSKLVATCRLAELREENVIQLWQPATGRLKATLSGPKGTVWALAFSPDGRTLASGGDDRTIRLWDVQDLRRPPRVLTGHAGSVMSLAFSPDGRTLASTSGDVKLWQTATRRELATFTVPGDVHYIAWAPDGQLLAGGGDDADGRRGLIALWHASAKAN